MVLILTALQQMVVALTHILHATPPSVLPMLRVNLDYAENTCLLVV